MSGRAGGTSRPLVSVVVPVYNVSGYLSACLDSISSQNVGSLEIVAVDDGSTDNSPAILAEAAHTEPRLQIVTQPNAGLGAARNTGVANASGQFLWFVDSDDVLVPGAIERLLATITTTGSDLATGNVLRLTGGDTRPARFLAPTFERNRLRTHIHRFPPLIADRVAWNKLYRRSFWDAHDFRFPEGVHYEDQYVSLPAHYLARAVDVHRDAVYLWRIRDDADSITQQRADPQSMVDRIHAVEYVSSFLAGRGLAKDKRRYDESAVTHDLRYFLAIFDQAGPDYRDTFLATVTPYLERVDEAAFAHLPALQRLQWDAARRGDAEGLAELVRFERDDLPDARATREGRGWYGEFPGRGDPTLPAEAFRVHGEMRLVSTIDELAVDADAIRVRGHASVDRVGPARHRLRMVAVPERGAAPLVLRTTVAADGGYVAELPLTAAHRATLGRPGSWRLVLHSHDRGLRRVAVWHERDHTVTDAARVFADPPASGFREVRLELVGRGRLRLGTGRRPPIARAVRIDDTGVLDLVGDLGDAAGTAPMVTATGPGGAVYSFPAHVDKTGAAATFVARLPVEPLLDSAAGGWSLGLASAGGRSGIVLAGPCITAEVAGVAVEVGSDDSGYLVLRTFGQRGLPV
jgi:glycosyltransferase involved in cell wall biosynthesis